MQMWGNTPVLVTQGVRVPMRRMLRLLLIGVWICSNLMGVIWTGSCWQKVSFKFRINLILITFKIILMLHCQLST